MWKCGCGWKGEEIDLDLDEQDRPTWCPACGCRLIEHEEEERFMSEKFTTTFWQDFSIADVFGPDAVQDTYNRAFEEWKHDYRYLTDLVVVLNHKIWYWYSKNETLARLYNDLWDRAAAWALDNLKGDELTYYLEVTD